VYFLTECQRTLFQSFVSQQFAKPLCRTAEA
jgi:hypothetical protein